MIIVQQFLLIFKIVKSNWFGNNFQFMNRQRTGFVSFIYCLTYVSFIIFPFVYMTNGLLVKEKFSSLNSALEQYFNLIIKGKDYSFMYFSVFWVNVIIYLLVKAVHKMKLLKDKDSLLTKALGEEKLEITDELIDSLNGYYQESLKY